MTELICTWVPGTVDRVRLKRAGHTVEFKVTRLLAIFGRHSLNELYLTGRVVLQASPQQIALLA